MVQSPRFFSLFKSNVWIFSHIFSFPLFDFGKMWLCHFTKFMLNLENPTYSSCTYTKVFSGQGQCWEDSDTIFYVLLMISVSYGLLVMMSFDKIFNLLTILNPGQRREGTSSSTYNTIIWCIGVLFHGLFYIRVGIYTYVIVLIIL